MAKREVRRSQRGLTAEEKSRMRRARREVERERAEILRRAAAVFADHEQTLAQTIGALRQARESSGLSLQDVAERMGTDRANVYRLETAGGNPTIATLVRYAEAVGKRVIITLQDNPA